MRNHHRRVLRIPPRKTFNLSKHQFL